MTSPGLSQPVFIGRQREMADLMSVLDVTISGRGQVVMVAGEPGIGKTRAVSELASYAQTREARVIWGWCYEDGGAPPYWPWIQSIRSHVRGAMASQLASDMGAGAADIATLVPAVHEKLTDLRPSSQLEPEQARFRLFDSIANFFRNTSNSSPLVIILEDLHWADRSSLLLWEFLSREISDASIMLIGTYRDVEVDRTHPLSRTIGTLIREPHFRRIHLEGLTQQDVGKFVEINAGIGLAESQLQLVHARTEGNPLFLNELVRLRNQEVVESSDDWTTVLPEGIRDVIGRRLDRLSEQCHEVLTVASVVGREFSIGQLTSVLDSLTDEQLMDVLEEGRSTHIVEEMPNVLGRYQFTHALIQESLAEELSTNHRLRLHARIAEALEQLYAPSPELYAAELVHHFFEAQTVLGTEKLLLYSLTAGERALASNAPEEALTQFERALAVKEGTSTGREGATDAETATVLSGLGHAQVALDRRQEAISNLTRAFDYYVDAGEISLAVAIAQNPHSASLIVGMRDIISRSVQLAPAGSLESGRVLSSHGYCLGLTSGSYESAQEAFDEALAIARANNDTALEMRVLANSANIDGWHLRWETCLTKCLQSLELASEVDDSYSKLRAHQWAYHALLSANGDIDGARVHVAGLRSTSARLRDALWMPRSFYYESGLFCIAGLWPPARELCDQGLALFPKDPILLGQRALIEHQVGYVTQSNSYLQRLLESREVVTSSLLAEYSTPVILARIFYVTGNGALFNLVQEDARSLISSPSGHPSSAFSGRCSLALLAVQQGDVSLSGELYPALVPQRGTSATLAGLAVDRLLGLLAHTMGDLDQACVHFDDALAFCEKAGYRPELAWTYCEYGRLLLERKGSEDLPKAKEFLDRSLTMATELGMPPLMDRVAGHLEATASKLEGVRGYPDGLTEREVDVLRLIASGRTNREIGDELFISARTVANHVASIFNKTGAANRAEAATYASRRGIV